MELLKKITLAWFFLSEVYFDNLVPLFCLYSLFYDRLWDFDVSINNSNNNSDSCNTKGSVIMEEPPRQAATNLWTKPSGLSLKPACRLVNHIYHCYLLLLGPIADTYFTVPQRVEGWVIPDGWLHTVMV